MSRYCAARHPLLTTQNTRYYYYYHYYYYYYYYHYYSYCLLFLCVRLRCWVIIGHVKTLRCVSSCDLPCVTDGFRANKKCAQRPRHRFYTAHGAHALRSYEPENMLPARQPQAACTAPTTYPCVFFGGVSRSAAALASLLISFQHSMTPLLFFHDVARKEEACVHA